MSLPGGGKLIYSTPSVGVGNVPANVLADQFTIVNDTVQQMNPLGGIYLTIDSVGRPKIYRYLQLNATSVATAFTEGIPVYYKDRTRTILTHVPIEAATHVAASNAASLSFAGLLANNTAPTNANFVWILTGGFSGRIAGPVGTIAGDMLTLSNAIATVPTVSTFVRTAAATDVAVFKGSINCCCMITDALVGGFAQGWLVTPTAGIW